MVDTGDAGGWKAVATVGKMVGEVGEVTGEAMEYSFHFHSLCSK